MAPPGLPFPLLLLLLVLLSEGPLAASGQEDEVKDGVGDELGPAGPGVSSVSLPASNSQEECLEGYFKDQDSPEMCQRCSSCGNLPIITECSPTNDRVCGSTGNSLPEWLVPVVLVLLACVVLVGLALYFCCTKREPANKWDGPDGRNSSNMHLDPMDTENNQCKSEEKHNLLTKKNSDSTPDSAISKVPELLLQSGAPNTPPIAQMYARLNDPGSALRNHS